MRNQNRPPSGRNGHPDFFARKWSTCAVLLMTLCAGCLRLKDKGQRISVRVVLC